MTGLTVSERLHYAFSRVSIVDMHWPLSVSISTRTKGMVAAPWIGGNECRGDCQRNLCKAFKELQSV